MNAPIAVEVNGSWSSDDAISWVGLATSVERFATAAFVRQPSVLAWAKAKPALATEIKLRLHPLDRKGQRFQPILQVGSGFISQSIECSFPKPWPSDGVPVSKSTGSSPPRASLELPSDPPTWIELVFLPASWIKVGRNHIWRLKSDRETEIEERYRTALQGGRAGRIDAAELHQ